MTLKLDRSREDLGTIHGEPINWTDPETGDVRTAVYQQDGFLFDVEGELIEGLLTPQAKARLEKKTREAEAKRAAEEAYRKALGTDAPADTRPRVAFVDPDAPVKGAAIDLQGWLSGEAKYPFDQVAEECRKLWNIKPGSKAQAKRLIESNGTADLTELG